MTERPRLQLIKAPVFFGIRGNDAVASGEGFGANCDRCGKTVSAPHEFQKQTIWCIYCGIETDAVVAVECDCFGHEYTFGVTATEAADERYALGISWEAFEQMCEARAIKLGQIAGYGAGS